jgi:hypothetical protein
MTQLDYIPEGYDLIKVVDDLYAFFVTDFEPKANVVLYPRILKGDFDRLAEVMCSHFDLKEGELFIKYSEREKIEAFRDTLDDFELFECVETILADMECLYSARVKTHMRLVAPNGYKKHKDVHNFHVDGLNQDFDRFMSCYNSPVTQYVCNHDVLSVSGNDVEVRPDASVYQFNVGDFWKARVRNKQKNSADNFLEKVLREKEKRAFVHRAIESQNPRVMVVGDKQLS